MQPGSEPWGQPLSYSPEGPSVCPLKTFPEQRVRQREDPSLHAEPRDGQGRRGPCSLP